MMKMLVRLLTGHDRVYPHRQRRETGGRQGGETAPRIPFSGGQGLPSGHDMVELVIRPARVPGVERSEPPETERTGGSLRSTPATLSANLELLNLLFVRRGVQLRKLASWGLSRRAAQALARQ